MRIFRCRPGVILEKGRIDTSMLGILHLADGRKSVASIAFASGMTMSEFQRAMKTLIDLGLIVPVDAEDALVD